MDEDAYDVVANYANVKGLIAAKEYCIDDGGRMNMCTAIKEMMKDSRQEGRLECIRAMVKMARRYCASDEEILEQLVAELSVDENEAREYLRRTEDVNKI